MSVTITEKQIKSKIKLKEKMAVVENIKYPCFESETNKKLCDRMNAFYLSVAQKFSKHAHTKLLHKIERKFAYCRLPMVLNMNYTVALCDENLVSIVLDLSFSAGKEMRMRRFSQMWSVKNSDIVRPWDIVKRDRKSKKMIFSNVLMCAKENGEAGTFGYYGDYVSRLTKNFDISNFFVVPNGVCFFVNAGVLSPKKYGPCGFVIPFGRIVDAVNNDLLPVRDEKTAQITNIVNNV